MEIKLALHEFCFVKKYFSVFHFNYKIQSFNYGPADSCNKPSPNFTNDSVKDKGSYTIHQSAAQTWCLLQVFPFLVADRVPLDDPHLTLVVLLKRISCIIFSHVISEDDHENLSKLIDEHHLLFFTLYPPPSETRAGAQLEEEELNNSGEEEEGLDDPENFLEEPSVTDQGEEVCDESMDEMEVAPPQPPPEHEAPGNQKKKKKQKKIRPINKHHHLKHYSGDSGLIRKYGPAVLYWCMRFEAKHSLPKRFGAIVGCFKNLPLTFIDIQQMYQCAELLDLNTEVSEEIAYSRGLLKQVADTPHFEALSVHGVLDEDVLEEIKDVTVAGFNYKKGLYVNLELGMADAPLFGLIINIYADEDNDRVFIITEDHQGLYDARFGAFLIEKVHNTPVRALLATNFADRPMTAWTADSKSFFLSPRRTLAERLLHPDA